MLILLTAVFYCDERIEKMNAVSKKKYSIIIKILLLGTVLAGLKCVVVSLQMDEEYAFSMSYRLLRGDKLLAQIWDPHQTSAFLIQALLWIYMKLFHTTTYVVIFIRCVGVGTQAIISIYLFRFLQKYMQRENSLILALLYFNLSPKTYVIPEFSNMMVWGMTMLLICLVKLGEVKDKQNIGDSIKGDFSFPQIAVIVEMAFWTCFMVLAYPSCALIFVFVLVVLCYVQKQSGKVIAVYSLLCVLTGIAYLGFLLTYMSAPELIENVRYMLASCGSHSGSLISRMQVYGLDVLYAVAIMLGYFIVTILLFKFLEKKWKLEKQGFLLVLMLVAVCTQFLHWILMLWDYEYSYPYTYYFCIFILGFWGINKVKDYHKIPFAKHENEKAQELEEGKIYSINLVNIVPIWLWGNVIMYIAILLLTNLNLFTSVKYLMPGVIMGVVGLLFYCERSAPVAYRKLGKLFLICWCFVAIFVKGWVYTDDEGAMRNITSIGNIISVGPAKGIITDYMQGYMQENIYEELQAYVKPGDSLVVFDNHTMCYMYQDVSIGSYTTICTPTYDDNILTYWEKNPEKYPDVIAVRCWFGELKWDPKWDQDEWMLNWVQNEFGATEVVDGKYLRYFIRHT